MQIPPLEMDILTWIQDRHARTLAGEPTGQAYGSAWVERDQHRAYLRYAPRPFLAIGQVRVAVTVANISLPPRARGHGWFEHTLLPALEAWSAHSRVPLVVENVFNPRLEAFLRRRGYRPTGPGETDAKTLAWPDTFPRTEQRVGQVSAGESGSGPQLRWRRARDAG